MVKGDHYRERFYRGWVKDRGLRTFSVAVRETDLLIRATRELGREALAAVVKYRNQIEGYIAGHPDFVDALRPLPVETGAPPIVRDMAKAGELAGVGPMAAVAGAIAEYVGRDLLPLSREVVVENGGDIFIKSERRRMVGIYAGASPFTGKLAMEIEPEDTPLGICTSSGTVGHSLSFGQADAVVIVSRSAALADAAATAVGNSVKGKEGIEAGLARAREIEGVRGSLIIVGNRLGAWGEIKLA
ncbi:MAG: UPF0280 family protein [bacterium]